MAKGLQTPIGRLVFLNLFKARAASAGQEPKFSAGILIDPVGQKSAEYIAMKRAVQECGAREWGEQKMKDVNFLRGIRLPFRPAGEKDYEGFEDGFIFVNATSKEKPGLVNHEVEEITVPGDVWSGQLGRMLISPFCYSVSGNTGISFGLNGVQITKMDMPRLDGRIPAHKAFSRVEQEEMAGADDDIAF